MTAIKGNKNAISEKIVNNRPTPTIHNKGRIVPIPEYKKAEIQRKMQQMTAVAVFLTGNMLYRTYSDPSTDTPYETTLLSRYTTMPIPFTLALKASRAIIFYNYIQNFQNEVTNQCSTTLLAAYPTTSACCKII